MLRNLETRGLLHGIAIARRTPQLSHLFIVDDSLIFIKANYAESAILKDTLESYGKAPEQIIDYNKFVFSSNMGREMREQVKNILQVHKKGTYGNYLGLPAIIGRDKKKILAFIKERIMNRMNSWMNMFLSMVGREILLKNVIQAIPLHAMSMFLLTKTLVKEL